jgi:hypothetical protein
MSEIQDDDSIPLATVAKLLFGGALSIVSFNRGRKGQSRDLPDRQQGFRDQARYHENDRAMQGSCQNRYAN